MVAQSKMEMAVFDIWADYGHFRRGYTTTSPLTYPFPSRTALSGIIAAILGLERNSYYDLFSKDNSAFALQILNPIKKVTFNQNLIDTKTGYYLWDNKGQRTQIPFEYLKNPKYRIFVWLKDENLFKKLCELVSQRKTTYTLYMGITEHIAQFQPYKGGCLTALKKEASENTKIHSIVPVDSVKVVVNEMLNNYVLGYSKVPGFMNEDRVVSKYLEFYYEENGKPLLISEGNYYDVGGELNIVPF